jgi:hypothetical protein
MHFCASIPMVLGAEVIPPVPKQYYSWYRKAGELLARHFPRRPDDQNELPDEIEHG